jgi:hypothetical protein
VVAATGKRRADHLLDFLCIRSNPDDVLLETVSAISTACRFDRSSCLPVPLSKIAFDCAAGEGNTGVISSGRRSAAATSAIR